jgi:hypothetical protein
VVREKIFKWFHPIFMIISPLTRIWPFNCTFVNLLKLRMICTKFDWNWPAGSREFFSIPTHVKMVSPFVTSPNPEDYDLYKFESAQYQKALVWIWAFLALWFMRRRFLYAPPPYFCSFVIISPLKRTWHLICTILNSLNIRMICTKFDWNWDADSGKDDS